MKIPDDVLTVLTDPRTVIEGDKIRIPFELDRLVYKHVNTLLKDVGGKWDGRKAVRAHTFPFPVEDFMRQALLAGEFPSRFDQGWYPSPPQVVYELLEHASIRDGMTVLEPSAGIGSIAGPAAGRGGIVDCVEIDQRRAHVLREQGAARAVVHDDFLTMKPLDYKPYKRVVMNPPFDKAREHVLHAMGFMDDDAVLVAVMPMSIEWSYGKEAEDFRALIEEAEADVTRLRSDAFETSGVPNVATCLVTFYSGECDRLPTHGWHERQPRQLDLFAMAG